MAERKYTHGLKLKTQGKTTILSIGSMEIWDGADLSLVRDTIYRLVNEDSVTSIGIDMSAVQHVPSGFFGMLYDWYERGISIQLCFPRSRVQNMLWFQKFFVPENDDCFILYDSEIVSVEPAETVSVKREDFNVSRFSSLVSAK